MPVVLVRSTEDSVCSTEARSSCSWQSSLDMIRRRLFETTNAGFKMKHKTSGINFESVEISDCQIDQVSQAALPERRTYLDRAAERATG